MMRTASKIVYLLVICCATAVADEPAKTQPEKKFFSREDVEAFAKGHLEQPLAHLRETDKVYQDAAKQRQTVADRVRRLQGDPATAPQSLADAQKELDTANKAMRAREVEFVSKRLPPHRFDSAGGIPYRESFFSVRPKDRAEETERSVGSFAHHAQHADAKYRDKLKELSQVQADLTRRKALLKDVTDPDEKSALTKALKDLEVREAVAVKAADATRSAYLSRLLQEIADGSGIKPKRFYSVGEK